MTCKRCLEFERIKRQGSYQVSVRDYEAMPPHTCKLRKD